jgi:hypothetical protein
MTDRIIPVSAQWALHGKAPDAEGYRVLACSTGELGKGNFADALSRFTLGALDTLPQVSVSFLAPATRPSGSYLALAIHWFAKDDKRYADGVLPLDDLGRETAFTSYFCAPYKQLADAGVTYLDMYKGFGAVTLPVQDGMPEPVTIKASAPQIPAIDDLSMRVAALLLTGTPVCVLGAENIGMSERLQFIDTVMALLPYGFHAKMTAATLTKATNRDHKFRLFFSSTPRSAEQPDHLVTWGEPDQAAIPLGLAGQYFEVLAEKVSSLARLRDVTTEIGFSPKAANQALELLDGMRHRPPRRPAAPSLPDRRPLALSAGGGPTDKRDTPPPASLPPEPDPIETALRECADFVQTGNTTLLRSNVRWLENQAKTTEIDDSRRRRYQALIAKHKLLDPHPELKRQEGEFYAALLAVAFGRPLGYRGYCQVEKCLGIEPGARLHPTLLDAIERGSLDGPIVTAIVLDHLDTKKLDEWLGSGQINVTDLISLLADPWDHPNHAQILCDVTLIYLQQHPRLYDCGKVRTTLRWHGFLARALYLRHPKEQYQFYALHGFLTAAYPSGLDRAAILQVLTGTRYPPTSALFSAVLKLLTVPGDWELAWKAYAYGSATLIEVDAKTSAQLLDRVPDVHNAATINARPSTTAPGQDPAGPELP